MWGEFAKQTKQVGRICVVDSLETEALSGLLTASLGGFWYLWA